MNLLTRELTMPPRVPIARQIYTEYRERIESGELRPGDKLPSTAEIAVAYNCSETPVKTAVGLLRELGYVEGHQGKGVFVTKRPPRVDRTE